MRLEAIKPKMTNTMASIMFARNVCIAFSIMLILIPFIILFCDKVVIPFIDERSSLKIELSCSESTAEKRYWKKELRKLYLRQIPLIGMFFK